MTKVVAIVDNPSNGGFVQLKEVELASDTQIPMSPVGGTCSTGAFCTLTDESIDQGTIDNVNRYYGVVSVCR